MHAGESSGQLPLDIVRALQGELPAVALSLAWVTHLLQFASRDESALSSEHMQGVMHVLTRLRSRPELSPLHEAFSPAAFIIRAQLEGLMPRLGADLLEPNSQMRSSQDGALGLLPPSSGAYVAPSHANVQPVDEPVKEPLHGQLETPADSSSAIEGNEAAAAAARAAQEGMSTTGQGGESANAGGPLDGLLLDQRILQLCCPQLDAARQALQVFLSFFPPPFPLPLSLPLILCSH